MNRLAALLLLLGAVLRAPALFTPIEEGYRNAQTATLTAGMIEDGSLRLDPIAPWRGDLDARLVQELPVFNLAALAISSIPGIPLDTAGRLASLIFWVLSFIALQALWRRSLAPAARFWANLLFVLAPMSWYLSTAFMPETLIQLLSIVFIVLTLDYVRQGKASVLIGLIAVAALGLLIKLPAFAHLGIFAALVLVDRRGFSGLFRPGLFVGAAFILCLLVLWGRFADSVNAAHFPYWTGWENLIGFVRPTASRLSLGYYLPLLGYNLAFVLPVVAAPLAAIGLLVTTRRFRSNLKARIWLYLLASLAVYWLVWGKGAPAQNYYNLPNLVLFSALFGLGVARSLRWLRDHEFPAWAAPLGQTLLILALAGSGFVGYRYLSRPDYVTVEVAKWVNANTAPSDLIIYQPRHAAAVMDYEHQPLLSHLSGRRTWIWTRSTPESEKERALHTSSYAIVTNPPQETGVLDKLRRRFKGIPQSPPAPISELYSANLCKVSAGDGYEIYRLPATRSIVQ